MTRAAPTLVTVAVLLAGAAPAGADVVAGQLIVRFDAGTSGDRARALVEDAGGRVDHRLGRIGAVVVRVRRGVATSDLRTRLRRLRAVRYAENDAIQEKVAEPDDPLYANQYALQPTGNGISAPQAWNRRTGCSKIAVLDSGTQYDHPDLKPNIWHNSNEVKANGKDDDKNGYVDDYYGVNVEKGSGSGKDGDGHGTHVAGIVAGRGNNSAGISGACWTATVMPIRFMNDQGRGATSDAVAGIEYAIEKGAKVVNCSFGSSSKSSALEDAVEDAKKAGVLLVVAAGNDGESIESHPSYPASYTQGNILTVAATTAGGGLAGFSNFGSKSVDLAAPGEGIYSTYPTSSYRSLNGTSMAAPFVAAAAAMLRQLDSGATYSELRTMLKSSVDPVPALSGKMVTGGRLNLDRALQQAD